MTIAVNLHKDLSYPDVHAAHAYEYADAAAREGASGFQAVDVGKIARQLDNDTFWILVATTPAWRQIDTSGALTYKGVWDASTNTPTLSDSGGGGVAGDFYVVSVSGSTTIDGISSWVVGDWIVNNGTVWEKADHTDTVTSVAGKTGAVTLDHDTDLANNGTTSHADIDTHVGSTTNPHGTAIGNLGSGTLAELNSAVTDANLDDVSSSRPPSGTASGGLNGTYPSPGVNGMTAGVLTDDTAHGSRGGGTTHAAATTSVNGFLSSADKTKLDALVLGKYTFIADQFESPNNADWAVNALAALGADSNNGGLPTRTFDDASEEGVGFSCEVPEGATSMTLRIRARAETAPGAPASVALNLYERALPDNAAVTSWSSAIGLTNVAIPANENFQEDEETLTLATAGLTAGQMHQFELTRDGGDASDTLIGDWTLHSLVVEFN